MIQRIQSVWLLLAAITIFFVFKFSYAGGTTAGGPIDALAASSILMFIVAVLLILMPLVTIFLFKNRPTQKNLIWLAILLDIVFIVMMYFEAESLKTSNPQSNITFRLGAIFPIIYIVLLVMAYNGVRKDQKLIKSLDRLR